MPSRDSLTKSSTELMSFFTPASRVVGTARRSRLRRAYRIEGLVDPPPRALDRLLPLGVAGLALVLGPTRLERPVHLPVLAHLVQRGPVAGGQPGQVGRAQGGRLLDLRADHRDPEDVGLELHEEIVLDRAAVDPHVLQPLAGVLLYRLDHVAGLVALGLERRPDQVGPVDVAGQADDDPAGALVPVGGEQAREGGYEVGAAGVLDR